jgi:hypothetical protein
MISIIQEWMNEVPLRQQGVIILALRGPDGVRKEHPAKAVIRSLRGCVMNSGRLGKPMERGETFDGDAFMRMDLICDNEKWAKTLQDFYSSIDEYNLHFFQHLIHAAAALGINHPDEQVRGNWWDFYTFGCHKLHVTPETKEEFVYRLRNGRRLLEDE